MVYSALSQFNFMVHLFIPLLLPPSLEGGLRGGASQELKPPSPL